MPLIINWQSLYQIHSIFFAETKKALLVKRLEARFNRGQMVERAHNNVK